MIIKPTNKVYNGSSLNGAAANAACLDPANLPAEAVSTGFAMKDVFTTSVEEGNAMKNWIYNNIKYDPATKITPSNIASSNKRLIEYGYTGSAWVSLFMDSSSSMNCNQGTSSANTVYNTALEIPTPFGSKRTRSLSISLSQVDGIAQGAGYVYAASRNVGF